MSALSVPYYMSDYGIHKLSISSKGFSTWAKMLGAIRHGYLNGCDLESVAITSKMYSKIRGEMAMPSPNQKPTKKKPGKGKGR